MKKSVFQLEELTCPSCIKKIETTLTKVDGIESVKVLFNSSKVKTDFNEEQVTAAQIEETIKKLGYEVLSTKVS
ncbi:heavy-metal-associated domain-containing protein [Calidifontibacillus oryziterrae]|uniref:heavy-metal-associated domain-containing protein n=1 Tax=Calidifontibacillus oryziterrae TaxID=1191699 RepID=UPI0002E6867B|nr:heavy-metal-associated domain-containing protein [Calidifontibacillus oryziterrae]